MAIVDTGLLTELGLETLPAWERELLLNHLTEMLETRVGISLVSKFSDDQLDEFDALMARGDEAAALAWLKENHSDYKTVVAAELDALKGELKEHVPSILAISLADRDDRTDQESDSLMLVPAASRRTREASGRHG